MVDVNARDGATLPARRALRPLYRFVYASGAPPIYYRLEKLTAIGEVKTLICGAVSAVLGTNIQNRRLQLLWNGILQTDDAVISADGGEFFVQVQETFRFSGPYGFEHRVEFLLTDGISVEHIRSKLIGPVNAHLSATYPDLTDSLAQDELDFEYHGIKLEGLGVGCDVPIQVTYARQYHLFLIPDGRTIGRLLSPETTLTGLASIHGKLHDVG
jgi:hypothetical protein